MSLDLCILEGHIECNTVRSRPLQTSFVTISLMQVGKEEGQEGSFQMVQSAQMSGLPVQFDGFQVHQHMIS